MSGHAEINRMIARLGELKKFAKEAAPIIAEELETELRKNIAAGEGPDGKEWEPRKDGGQPLQTAGKALTVVVVDAKIFARLKGHVARHHLGRAKGGVERHILPAGGIPPGVVRATRKALALRFGEIMVGGDAG